MATVLQINTTLNCGSTGRIAEQIGLLAQTCGYECVTAHGSRRVIPSRLPSVRVNTLFDEKVHGGWYSLLCDRHGLGSVGTTKRFVDRIRTEIKPDIVHLHNIHGYYLNYRILFEYLQQTDIPIVWTLHDCWPLTGHCVHFERIGCDKWKTECRACPSTHTYPRSLFADNSERNYRMKKRLFSSIAERLTLVPVSDWLGGLAKQSFLGRSNIRVIHNGIDIDSFQPYDATELIRKNGLEQHRVILGVASPWTESKGLYDLIELRKLLPQTEYAIAAVGLSKKQISELPAGIIGIERTRNVWELAQWYSAADVFVNPTYEDNYPTTNLEAMACGTPVVTYRTGGSPEAVTSGTGRVVDQGDLPGMAAAIEAFSVENRDMLRAACRRRAEENFDCRQCFQSYIRLYGQLLHR